MDRDSFVEEQFSLRHVLESLCKRPTVEGKDDNTQHSRLQKKNPENDQSLQSVTYLF
jgi:hypothetical protein